MVKNKERDGGGGVYFRPSFSLQYIPTMVG